MRQLVDSGQPLLPPGQRLLSRRFAWLSGLVLVLGPGLGLGCGKRSAQGEPDASAQSRALLASDQRAWFSTQTLVANSESWFPGVAAMSGNHVLFGGPGGVYAFERVGDQWANGTSLVVGDPPALLERSFSVAISGTTALVGNQVGQVAYVYSVLDSSWTRTSELQHDSFTRFGSSVALDGDIAVVGAEGDGSAPGDAYVFARSGDQWLRQKQLRASDESLIGAARYGAAVAVSGRTIVVGAPNASEPTPDPSSRLYASGRIYIYTMPADESEPWPETVVVAHELKELARLGASLAASEDTIVAGAPGDASAGSCYVFKRQGSTWVEQQELKSGSETAPDRLGTSVAMSDGHVVVGAPLHSPRPRFVPGAAFVFAPGEGGWTLEQDIVPSIHGKRFGGAVALSGEWMIVGAPSLAKDELNEAPIQAALSEAHVYRRLGASGASCSTSADCGLAHCVSGVCCDSACSDACEECSTGVCKPSAAGTVGTPACPLYLCDGSARTCPTRCLTSDDCVETHYCSDRQCEPKAGLGEVCTEPEQCVSGHCLERRCSGTLPTGAPCERASDCERGHCVDGFCCDDACEGQCEACDVSSREGKCSLVTGPPRGDREPCVHAGTVCGGRCGGETRDGCAYPTGKTDCGSTCEDARETRSACDGQGECVAGRSSPCGRFRCDAEGVACGSNCETDQDCAEGLSCWEDGNCAASPRCTSDRTASETAPDGSVNPCTPYVCGSDGHCLESCSSSDHCSKPWVCDTRQTCVALSDADTGCGCRTQGRSSPGWRTFEMMLVPFTVAKIRARSKRRKS